VYPRERLSQCVEHERCTTDLLCADQRMEFRTLRIDFKPSEFRKHVEVCGWSVVARGLLCCPSELAVLFPPIILDDGAEESDGIRPVSTPRHSLVLTPPGDE
jgi:hypothetical protein